LARAELLAIEGRLDEARTALDAGHTVARARGESEFIAWTLTIYARLARTRGQFRASLRSAHEAARLAEESGNASNHVLALGAVGIAQIGLGRFREAIESLEQALAEARRHQTGLFEEARLLKDLARARLSLGDYPGARSDASDAVEVARRQGAPTLECLGLLTRARAWRASDAVKEFETDLAAALVVAEATGATACIQEIKSEQRRVRW
jgi:tetratricopeptide (TPR) repeat protein